ncbi:LarC family nickel insertion protein [Catenovulum sediminis]|uniref:LarC family nickel insertion protein n=1 Tax=Catenovulum sediminis TaxID=1740262 RepID=UPI00117CCA8F|nr:LarC family nickel insertion protein [Catenovulum sediminis]
MCQMHIQLDIVGGIAGDMFVAGMLDCFSSLKPKVLEAVATVVPHNVGHAELTEGINSGISGLHFKLHEIERDGIQHNHHGHHTHHSDGDHQHTHHTTYRYICQHLQQSGLDASVCQVAIDILTIIGKAEAKIHSKSLDEVHFHELADWDSVMDVVAVAVILDALKDTRWSISKLPLGQGLVNTAHGLIPVPAPATAEILQGFEFVDDGVAGERITPTGAAILRYLHDTEGLCTSAKGILQGTGYGLGTKKLANMPNILRVLHFSQPKQPLQQSDQVMLIEFDVDDMTGEELATAADIIRATEGVIDLLSYATRGKKNRPVESFRVMVKPDQLTQVVNACFNQTSTIGLRYRLESRQLLKRLLSRVDEHQVKEVSRPDGTKTIKIEHDELLQLPTLLQRRKTKYTAETN